MRRKSINSALLNVYVLAHLAAIITEQAPSKGIVLAEPTSALFLAAVGLAVVAGLLLRPKVPASERDKRIPQLVERGTQLSYILGRRITPGLPVLVPIERRAAREESVSGGKKGGLFGGGPKQIVYYEDAVHAICLGPGLVLHRILKNTDEVIFEGPVSPGDTPSGSTLMDIEGNPFVIYWGEKLQPIDTDLGGDDGFGIASRWPYICRVHWKQRKLGSSAVWPQLDYDIECTCVGFTLPTSECSFEESEVGLGDTGMNGAHMLYQLLTGSYPHGGGHDPSWYDFGSLNALGELIETERIPQNILIAGGTGLQDIVEDILTDLGVFMVQEGHRIVFMPIRTPASPPVLDDRVIVVPQVQFDISHGIFHDDRIIFLYPDLSQFHHNTDILLSDDATSRAMRRKNSREIQLPTITDRASATRAAERVKPLYLSEANEIQFEGCRTGMWLTPGMYASLPGVGVILVRGAERSSTSSSAKITASIDTFDLTPSGWSPPGNGEGEGSSVGPDDLVMALEIPHDFGGEALALGVVRVREDGVGVSAAVWVSTNGVSYAVAGEQMASAAGGTLLEPFEDDGFTVVEDGPLISSSAAAMAKVQDLSANTDAWLTGQQICLVNDEICFLRNISAESGGYRLHGLARARLGTFRATHPAGDSVAIIDPSNIVPLESLTWSPGMTLYIKAQPSGVALEDISAVQIELLGKALGPYPIDNLAPLWRDAGDDLNFTWTDRIRRGSGCGAGEGAAGIEIAATPASEVDSYAIKVFNSVGLLVRETSVSSASWAYSYANQTTDGVEDKDISVEIRPIKGSFGGYPRQYIVEGTA